MEATAVAEAERRTSYLELFFDLVFVFAITQVTSLMLAEPTASGYAKSALVLAMVYWAWSGYAWATNAIDLGWPVLRLGYLAAMGASFGMAVAVPDAFGDQTLWFAIPYVAVRLLNLALYIGGLRHDRVHQRAILALAPWFAVSPALALIGAFLGGQLLIAFWCAGLAIDVLGALRAGDNAGFRVSPEHFAERYALFIIIALGESIVAIGTGGLTANTRDAAFALALAVAFVGVAAVWWAYFDFTAAVLARTLRNQSPERRGTLARDIFTLCHYPIVLGIIFFAVAAKKTVAEPGEPLTTAGRFALGAGIGFFLVGFALARYRVIRRIAWERVAAALPDAPGLGLMAIVVGCLVAGLVAETVRIREFRAEVRAGPTQH
ncbi:MAG: low temperature requirement protein A [Actinobacteria bacterium]|nr:low temperature requirement protein A [Actinomycetota bacterium]